METKNRLARLPSDPENAEPVPYRFDGCSCITCMFWTENPPDGASGRRFRCPLRDPFRPLEHDWDRLGEKLACTMPRPNAEEGIKYVPRETFGNEEDP